MKKYPVLVKGRSGYLKRKTCQLCKERTRDNLLIKWSDMRGDDEVFKICKDCQKPMKTVDDLQKALDLMKHSDAWAFIGIQH